MALQVAAHPLGLVTVSDKAVLVVRPALVPVMMTVAVPAAAVLLAVNVKAEVALPLAGGVSELEESDAVTPDGKTETLNDTAESNPLLLATVIVLVPDLPCAMERLLGESDSENDGSLEEPHTPPGPVQLPRSEVNSLL